MSRSQPISRKCSIPPAQRSRPGLREACSPIEFRFTSRGQAERRPPRCRDLIKEQPQKDFRKALATFIARGTVTVGTISQQPSSFFFFAAAADTGRRRASRSPLYTETLSRIRVYDCRRESDKSFEDYPSRGSLSRARPFGFNGEGSPAGQSSL